MTTAYSLQSMAFSLGDFVPVEIAVADVLIFAVVLAAFAFSVAWFATQRESLTKSVSCRCGKRQVVGIAPRAHPDFVKLLTANCPSCATAVSAVGPPLPAPPSEPLAQAPRSSAPPAYSLQPAVYVPIAQAPGASAPTAYGLQPSVSYLGDHDD